MAFGIAMIAILLSENKRCNSIGYLKSLRKWVEVSALVSGNEVQK